MACTSEQVKHDRRITIGPSVRGTFLWWERMMADRVRCIRAHSGVNSGLALEEVLYEATRILALCWDGVSGNGVPEVGTTVWTGTSAGGLANV